MLAALAVAFVVAGLVFGFRSVSAGGVSCGSVLSPSSAEAQRADFGEEIGGTLSGATPDSDTTNNQDACDSAVGDAKPLAYGGLGIGAVALIAAMVVSPARRTSA